MDDNLKEKLSSIKKELSEAQKKREAEEKKRRKAREEEESFERMMQVEGTKRIDK